MRRPLTPKGTNLLGLVKHLASVELGYFGETFDRPSGISLPWYEHDAEPNADLWATPGESRADMIDFYRIVRELIDGAVGTRAEYDNMAAGDQTWWAGYRDRVESAALEAGRLRVWLRVFRPPVAVPPAQDRRTGLLRVPTRHVVHGGSVISHRRRTHALIRCSRGRPGHDPPARPGARRPARHHRTR